ncbi:high mobility group family protein [Hymenobacter lapidiphilus]|uniref:Uncharacterized protein n=1 Tax=Hymenobacter lapidiphilus TaxID=2608003 RepID=A0A7Y7PLZ5_9BACT|nr:high mobility group family protein [Hymenobacter lapidiphilus]NVO30250.1 hypothetical protein [Hymenobacter lapidiphilus]
MTTQIAPIVGPQARKSLLTIQKASLKKQLLSAEFSEQLDLQRNAREFTLQGKDLVHPDLEACFAGLVPHFCLLTEQLKEADDYSTGGGYWPSEDNEGTQPHFNSYGVTGIVLGAKNGVTLVGFRQLENGKVLNMTAQYVSFAEQSDEFEQSDAWHYPHTAALEQLIGETLNEIEAALRGKCSDVGRQLGMFDEQPREIELGEATEPEAAPTKPRRRPAKANATPAPEAPKPAGRPRKKKEPVVAEATEPAA